MVSEDTLLKGSAFALHNAGCLLHSAISLYESRQYAGSVVLASLSAEETGKSKILLGFKDTVNFQGQTVTVDDVQHACEDHERKFGQSQDGVHAPLSAQEQLEFQKALKPWMLNKDDPKDQEIYDKYLRTIVERANWIKKKEPKKAVDLRLNLLYVDLKDDGQNWELPERISHEDAFLFLSKISVNYNQQKLALHNQYEQELSQWSDCPSFPDAILPSSPRIVM